MPAHASAGTASPATAQLTGCPPPSRLCRPQKLDAADAPLGFAPGEAYQFDWSHEIVLINGTTVTVKVAHFDISVAKKTSPIWRSNRRLA
jgi:hypothetical protein